MTRIKSALTEFNKQHWPNKLTQREFAKKYYGVKKVTPPLEVAISKIFSGTTKNYDVVRAARILNTSTDYLLGKTNTYQVCEC